MGTSRPRSASIKITPPLTMPGSGPNTPPQSTMDQKSPDYALEMCESAPESQPLTKHMFSDGSETDVDDFESLRMPHDRHSSRTIQRKHIILIVLLAIVSNLASGCVGFYYNKGPNLDAACSSYTTQYCEF